MRTHRYRITISGGLGKIGQEAFGNFLVESDGTHTALTGDLDLAGLYGALSRIQALGIELVGLNRLPDDVG